MPWHDEVNIITGIRCAPIGLTGGAPARSMRMWGNATARRCGRAAASKLKGAGRATQQVASSGAARHGLWPRGKGGGGAGRQPEVPRHRGLHRGVCGPCSWQGSLPMLVCICSPTMFCSCCLHPPARMMYTGKTATRGPQASTPRLHWRAPSEPTYLGPKRAGTCPWRSSRPSRQGFWEGSC